MVCSANLRSDRIKHVHRVDFSLRFSQFLGLEPLISWVLLISSPTRVGSPSKNLKIVLDIVAQASLSVQRQSQSSLHQSLWCKIAGIRSGCFQFSFYFFPFCTLCCILPMIWACCRSFCPWALLGSTDICGSWSKSLHGLLTSHEDREPNLHTIQRRMLR